MDKYLLCIHRNNFIDAIFIICDDTMNHKIFQNVLVLSPHTDDGELAAGGTMARFIEEGVSISYIAFSVPRPQLREECISALQILGVKDHVLLDFPRRHFPEKRQDILQFIFDYKSENDIDLVLVPSSLDLHQDHQTITQEALRAFKNSSIFGYELAWNHIIFRENCFVALEENHVKKKLEALMCYKSQNEKNYFNQEYLKSLTRSRGVQIKEKYAEAFEVIKLVIRN